MQSHLNSNIQTKKAYFTENFRIKLDKEPASKVAYVKMFLMAFQAVDEFLFSNHLKKYRNLLEFM